MYIPQLVLGIFGTLILEFILLIVGGVIYTYKHKNNENDKEDN